MPDVKVYIDEHKSGGHELIQDVLPSIVAAEMSCVVDGEYYKLDADKEIDLFVIFYTSEFMSGEVDIMMDSDTDIIIEVAAYDFPDRMANITERIGRIARNLRRQFNDSLTISITFIPVKQGCWVKV